jgi:hypothetical protein
MRGGIMMPKQQEPEDILAEMEGGEEHAPSEPEQIPSVSKGGKKFKVLVAILSGVAVVLILVIAGIFFYRQFVAVDSEETFLTDEMLEGPSAPTAPTVPSAAEQETYVDQEEEEEEAPPAVEPTPPPPGIPEPTAVEPEDRADADNDGLQDADEAMAGTDPRVSDTDGDGLLDGNELDLRTDPLVADTDGDGLTDGDEVNIWLSNPTVMDTDGDGYGDGEEVRNGYNPNGEGRLPG